MADAEYARFETMTNVELRAELKRRNCPTSGNKKDLLGKLRLALQKQYEQHTVESTQNEIPVPQNDQSIASEQNSSINEQSVLETSNNVENNSFVSKSDQEEEKNLEKIGEDIHLPSIDSSSSAKAESLTKEIPQINPTVVQSQPEIVKENEVIKEPEQPQAKPNRSQISTLMKISNRSTVNKINLTSELLQTLIPDLTLLPESMVTDELDSDENNESILETSISTDYLPADSMTIGELADQKQPTNRTVAIDDLSTRKKANIQPVRLCSFDGKTNNTVADEPVRIKEATITHEPPSEILYIRGLTRPFSLMQLKELLSRYGTLVDGEFWLDKIKSQCFVTYQTLDEAQNARQALDGCRWPSTNPKTLSIRYARQEEFKYIKTHDAPPPHLSADSNDRIVEESTSPIDEIEPNGNTAEFEVHKKKPSGFLITDEEVEEPVKTNEQSAKGLDDYFRKTKAKPSIYWLPLTEEEILERAHRQEQRKAERDEEQRKRETDDHLRKSDKRKNGSPSPVRRDAKRH